jgi:CubicO group peptidase (beta-lactamase class C family)
MNRLITRRSALKTFAPVGAASVFPRWLHPLVSLALADEPQPTPSEVELSVMAQSARLFMGRYQVPGLSFAIARHGQFVYRKSFGISDQATGARVTPSNLFRIASVTKPITSVAIFSLVEKGRLHLNDLVFGNGSILGFDYGSASTRSRFKRSGSSIY